MYFLVDALLDKTLDDDRHTTTVGRIYELSFIKLWNFLQKILVYEKHEILLSQTSARFSDEQQLKKDDKIMPKII